MKNVVKLTADELATVLDAIEVTAIARTLKESPTNADAVKNINSIDWQDVFSALFEMFDNGLSAMDIEIAEEVEAVEEEEEEEEEEYTPCDDCYHPYACNMCEYAEPEPEPETNPIDDMIFDYKGKRAISESDGKLMFDMCFEIVRKRNPEMSVDQHVEMAQQLFLEVAHAHGIEWVKEDEDE